MTGVSDRRAAADPMAVAAQAVPGTTDALRLPDGRVLAWTAWGPVDGRPVVFCSGAGTSGSLGFGVPALSALGLRLIALDRPGLGRSSPCPDRTLASWVDDVAHLLDRRPRRDALAVGFSQGAPFALALGGAGVVAAVAVVSGQDDFAAVRHLLHPDVAAMLAAAEDDPEGFEASIAARASADWLWSLVTGTAAGRDRELYTAGPLGAAYRRCLEEGFVQGPRGYARDLVSTLQPWPFPPEEITTPVTLWYGGRDTSTVHSPDLGRTLGARLPRGRRRLLPTEGSSVLWTRSADILAELAGLASTGPPGR